MERAIIYGDSLLKATVPDAELHYHFHLPEVMAQYPSDRLEVVNRAKMGATVTKGLSLVEHDVQRGIDARWALVAYGGNDSDFDWEAIAAAPEAEHLPRTVLPEFMEKLHCAVQTLRDAGVQPVLMTLPPIDAQRYFRFVSRRGGGESILRWLGDENAIYRYQERYSRTAERLAREEGCTLVDLRGAFLCDRRMEPYFCPDGIHPNEQGQALLHEVFADALERAAFLRAAV